MGFSDVVAQVVLFMTIMFVIIALTFVYKTYVATTNNSLDTQEKTIKNKIDTSFRINDSSYDDVSDVLSINLYNDGNVKLDPGQVDLLNPTATINTKIKIPITPMNPKIII